jgi:holliday junction DNA helicase RuvA
MMIEHLRGQLLSAQDGKVILDVGGVGYGLDVPQSTLDRLSDAEGEVSLHVSMVVREDAITLYGFATPAEKGVFEAFRDVSGIGPRTVIDILSTISIGDLLSAIQIGNIGVLTSVKGIGQKKAERLLLEMKSRVAKLLPLAHAEGVDLRPGDASMADVGEPDLFQDAVAALQALGFKPAAASRTIAATLRTVDDKTVTVEELIRIALQSGKK